MKTTSKEVPLTGRLTAQDIREWERLAFMLHSRGLTPEEQVRYDELRSRDG